MSNVIELNKRQRDPERAMKNRMHIQVNDPLLRELDTESEKLGLSRAQVVRMLLAQWLEDRHFKRA